MPAPQAPPAGITFTLTSRVKDLTPQVEQALAIALERMAIKWHERATLATPVDTGRLRASLTWSSPIQQKRVAYTTKRGDSHSFTPPKAPPNTLQLGTNVEYGPAVHEGIEHPGGDVDVKEHTVKTHRRKAHTRKTKSGATVRVKAHTVKAHTVKAHTRKVGPTSRAGLKFIERPARQLRGEFEAIALEELAKVGR